MKRDGAPAEGSSDDAERLAQQFEAARPRLRRMALRMLGSAAESDDALQESWLRIARADVASTSHAGNLDGWLTTVVARVCLDALKRRESRREEFTPDDPRRDVAVVAPGERPEEEALLADSIGAALLIVLDTLSPSPKRVAFVLHDTFDVPFEDVAAVVGRTPEAARQLASRARRRVRGASAGNDGVTQRNDELVRAFLSASRAGNFSALLALLDPGATLRADAIVVAMGGAAYWQTDSLQTGIEGADAVAGMFSGRALGAQPALLDGEPGAVWVEERALRVAFRFTIAGDRIAAIDLIGDRDALAEMVIEQ